MKKLLLISTFILAVFVLAACGSSNDLRDTSWQWTSLKETQPTSQSVVPNPENYTIKFGLESGFTAMADCNQARGSYQVRGKELTILLGPVTMAECGPDSLSDQFINYLSHATSYVMDGDKLVLIVGDDTARMTFQNAAPTK